MFLTELLLVVLNLFTVFQDPPFFASFPSQSTHYLQIGKVRKVKFINLVGKEH